MKTLELKNGAGSLPASPRLSESMQVDSTPSLTCSQAEPPPYDGPPWPKPMDRSAHLGLAGRFLELVGPQSEADPAALVVQFLVAFGNAAGRSAHWIAEGTPHYTNENAVIVGASSSARKGTSWGRVRELFAEADPSWEAARTNSGLNSGEGLIFAIRDARKTPAGEEEDPGISDKRLLLVESEFASVLAAAGRRDCTLSPVVRNAWDGSRLSTLVKGGGRGADVATNPHVSILGHITADELKAKLASCDTVNGFGNRFLWIAAKRARELPEGGFVNPEDLRALACAVFVALEWTRAQGRVDFTPEAATRWSAIYSALSEPPPGILGAMVARGPAHVRRLAVIYAMLDRASGVDLTHLEAAIAVWNYAQATAEHLFGGLSHVAREIYERLRVEFPGELSRKELHKLLGGHSKGEAISRGLNELRRGSLVDCRRQDTDGRPSELWRALPAN